MNKTSKQILDYIRELLLGIRPQSYDLEPIKKIYPYPAQVIPSFPSISLEFDIADRLDETLGDDRYIERYTVVIRAYIAFIDTEQNYISLLNMDRAIRDKLVENRVTTSYWRNSDVPGSDYSIATVGETMCRQVELRWIVEEITIPS